MRSVALPTLAIVLLAGCSAPTASTSTPSAPATIATTAPIGTASQSPSLTPTTAPSPTIEPSPSLAVVGKAPGGAWTALRWIGTERPPLGPTEVGVHGWSGGFVAFEQSSGSDDQANPIPVVIRAASSADGVHWSAPTTLDTGFGGNIAISTVVEGPSGLLALGYPYGDTCGGPETVAALWASTNGTTWTRLPIPKPFKTAGIQKIAGGPAGFIAFGTKNVGAEQAIWTSHDGRAWTTRTLPRVSSGTLALDDVASFDRGFVLVGSVLGEGGCGGPEHIRSAVWFSTDGAGWTREALPGSSSDPGAAFRVTRLLGRLIVTQILPGNDTTMKAWASTDGQTWSKIANVSNDVLWTGTSDGRHTVVVIQPDSGVGPATIIGVNEDGTGTTVSQVGGGPLVSEDDPAWSYAVGPTGILAVRADGEASWLGVPS